MQGSFDYALLRFASQRSAQDDSSEKGYEGDASLRQHRPRRCHWIDSQREAIHLADYYALAGGDVCG